MSSASGFITGYLVGSGAARGRTLKTLDTEWINGVSLFYAIIVSLFIVTFMNLWLGYGNFIEKLIADPFDAIIRYWLFIPFIIIMKLWDEDYWGAIFIGFFMYDILLYLSHINDPILPIIIASVITMLIIVFIDSIIFRNKKT